jgi:hypothetical protein
MCQGLNFGLCDEFDAKVGRLRSRYVSQMVKVSNDYHRVTAIVDVNIGAVGDIYGWNGL